VTSTFAFDVEDNWFHFAAISRVAREGLIGLGQGRSLGHISSVGAVTTPADFRAAGLSGDTSTGVGKTFSGCCRHCRRRVGTDTVYNTEMDNFCSTRCRGLKGIYNLIHIPGLVVLPEHLFDWVCPSWVYGKR
jgi:hypothetical protein